MKKLSMIVASSIFLFAGVAFAEPMMIPMYGAGIGTGTPLKEVRTEMKDIHTQRTDLKEQIKNVQNTVKVQIKDLHATTKDQLKNATSSMERKDIVQGVMGERKDMMDARKASTTMMRAGLKELARQHFGLVGQRFAIALRQFDTIITRIQSRIDKLKAAGVDTSSIETLLATAKTNVAQAITDAQAVSTLVAQVTDTSDPKTVRTSIEAAVKKAGTSMKIAHGSLEATAKELLRVSQANRKTMTASTTPVIHD